VALVLNLHGSGSTAASQEAFTGMDTTADAHGFIVAYPQGAIRSGSGYDWNVPGQPILGGARVPAGAADDVVYLSQLVTALEQQYCIDPHHVDATGFSGGARMASQLGCDLPARVAAIAPVSGLRFPSPCAGKRPMPVLSFHGLPTPSIRRKVTARPTGPPASPTRHASGRATTGVRQRRRRRRSRRARSSPRTRRARETPWSSS
jgi:poly(3-hydroxybutyrate) depolymerase